MTNIINKMRPIHLGEILREEFLQPLGMTGHALAMAIQVPAPRINDILRERRAVTVDTALRLAKYFGTSAEFWMGLQTDFDMATARITMADILSCIVSRDFVLYQPPLKPVTWLLWWGPLLILLCAVFLMIHTVKPSKKVTHQ